MEYKITLFLDKRRPVSNSESIFPVKLRVYSGLLKKAKLYSTGINLEEHSFQLIVDSTKPVKGKLIKHRTYLSEFLNRAEKEASVLPQFSFNKFEEKLFRSKNASIEVSYHYNRKIQELYENDQIKTAINYELSLSALGMFILRETKFDSKESKKIKVSNAVRNLTFYDIDPKWLQNFENFMVKDNDRSFTTVSIYLRCLKTIFKNAIHENDIKEDIYPFGRGKYQIPNAKRKKKSLSRQEVQILFKGTPANKSEERAKDFWFLIYSLNGINIKDILMLKGENVLDDRIHYFRKKTIQTKKANLKEISVFFNDYSKSIFAKYGKKDPKPKDYIFNVLSNNDSALTREKKIKNFTSHLNHFFDKYARGLGFDHSITSYWARHSFATITLRRGEKMEFISEILNHSNLNVTKNYFAGFEDETKKEFSKSLMDFN